MDSNEMKELENRISDTAASKPPPSFQVPVTELDYPKKVSEVIDNLRWNKTLAAIHALRLSNKIDQPFYSLRNIELRRFNDQIFDPVTGAVLLKVNSPYSPLKEFFTEERSWLRLDHVLELRGVNYYVSLDKNRRAPREKIAVIQQDITEALGVLAKVRREDITTGK